MCFCEVFYFRLSTFHTGSIFSLSLVVIPYPIRTHTFSYEVYQSLHLPSGVSTIHLTNVML